MRALLVCLVALSLGASANAREIRDHRQEGVLTALVQARTASEVRKAYALRRWPDAAVDIVYAMRLHDLHAAEADERLVDAIPRSPVDFWYAYDVFGRHDTPMEQRLADLYWRYWEFAPEAVVKSKRGFRNFLLLSAWATSGEMMGQLQDGNETLWNGNRAAVERALRTLDDETRGRICNEDGLPCGGS